MLRLYDVKGARFPRGYGSFGASSTDWAVYAVPLFGLSGNFTAYPLRIWEPDIIGDDITYPDEGLFHKWTSIRHFKCDGRLYPIMKSSDGLVGINLPTRKINFMTGDHSPLYLFYPAHANVTWYVDMSNDIEYTTRFVPRYDLKFHKLYHPKKTKYSDPDLFVTYAWNQQIFNVGDELSFSPYTAIPLKGIDVYINVRKWVYDPSSPRSAKLQIYSTSGTQLANYTTPLLFAREGQNLANVVSSYVEELIELVISDVKLSSTVTVGLQTPTTRSFTPRMPNYEAIFNEARRNPNWYDLAGQAYQTLGMSDINGIAYIHDLIEMGSQVRSFANTLSSLPSNKVKAAASAWLAVHYGFKLMLLDTIELQETLRKESLRNSRQSKCQAVKKWDVQDLTTIHFTARYQVFYNQYEQLLSEIGRLADLADAELTSENLWDMVPWSFVIDWFVGIGDVLQSLDTYANLLQKHKVIAAGKSIKGTCVAWPSCLGLPDGITMQGVQLSCYLRRYDRKLQVPNLLPKVTINPFNHLVEGAALFISRR